MANRNVTTTERSLRLLREIKERNGATLSELADECAIARSTVHKHLLTLMDHGFLSKEGESYVLGLKFLNYGEFARTRKREYTLAVETIQTLTDQTNEEVDFVVENDGRGIVVHESYHPHSQHQTTPNPMVRHIYAGTYYHLHRTASGKAILAELPETRVREIIEQWGLPERTTKTITSQDALYEELATIRDRGIAFSDEEYANGMRAVARRVKTPDGSVIGSISITAPTYRMTDSVFKESIPELLNEQVDSLESRIIDEYGSI